jgi:hypothetical protein
MIVKKATTLLQAFEEPKVRLKNDASLLTGKYTSTIEREELTQYKNHL